MPVVIADIKVFKESSVPLDIDNNTPKPLYNIDIIPNVLAIEEPLFKMWLINL